MLKIIITFISELFALKSSKNLNEEEKRNEPLDCKGVSLNSDIHIGKSDSKEYE